METEAWLLEGAGDLDLNLGIREAAAEGSGRKASVKRPIVQQEKVLEALGALEVRGVAQVWVFEQHALSEKVCCV